MGYSGMVRILYPADFPLLLREIPDPPKMLYVLGDKKILYKENIIAIVGTRQNTEYGKLITTNIVRGLVDTGFIIISGLALGIDGVAHQATLEAMGKTIAVLGTGVDIVYPPQHKDLYDQILKMGGAIISEMPPGQFVSRNMFAARNRIISGLSKAVVVIEGALKSGSLITARLALDQGRDVYAVPGSPGTNYLISLGARPVTTTNDILLEL